jgi:hypothetical protein
MMMLCHLVVDCQTVERSNSTLLYIAAKEADLLYGVHGGLTINMQPSFATNDFLSHTCTLLSVPANGCWLPSHCPHLRWWHRVTSTVC